VAATNAGMIIASIVKWACRGGSKFMMHHCNFNFDGLNQPQEDSFREEDDEVDPVVDDHLLEVRISVQYE
jgi:hypothetical protein